MLNVNLLEMPYSYNEYCHISLIYLLHDPSSSILIGLYPNLNNPA